MNKKRLFLPVLLLLLAGWFVTDRLTAESGDSATFGWDATNEVSIMRANSSYNVIPGKDDTYDLGDGTFQWQDAYFDGTVTADGISNAGTLSQTGTLAITGSASVSTDLTVTNSLILGAGAHQELVVSTSITANQIKALFGTPIALIDAPGSNYAIVFLDAVVFFDTNTAYGGIAGGEDIVFSYTDGSGVAVAEIETTGFLDSATDVLLIVYPHTAAVGTESSLVPVANAELVISLLTGEVTTGTGILNLMIHYKIVATNL